MSYLKYTNVGVGDTLNTESDGCGNVMGRGIPYSSDTSYTFELIASRQCEEICPKNAPKCPKIPKNAFDFLVTLTFHF